MLVVFLNLITSVYGYTTANIPMEYQDFKSFKVLFHGSDCGQSYTNRIVGGLQADLGQYPWMVRIGYTADMSGVYQNVDGYECGGSIISEIYVMTAAHCSPKYLNLLWVQVRVGEHNTTADIDCVGNLCAPPPQDIDIKNHYCHKHYSKETFRHDICVLQLASPIKFNSFVRPICLPFHNRFLEKRLTGLNMEVSGWGYKDAVTEESSDVLLALKVPAVGRKKCNRAYKDKNVQIKKGQICVGGVVGKDSCKGDSGGPLMAPFSIGGPARYFLVGIVSFGQKLCAEKSTPAVYTYVPVYIRWLLKVIDTFEKGS